MVRDRSVSSCQTWRAQRKRHGLRYRPYTRARELLLTRHLGERMWPGGSTSATPRLPLPCARSNCASSYARRAWSRTSDAPDLTRATRLRSLRARSGEHPANLPGWSGSSASMASYVHLCPDAPTSTNSGSRSCPARSRESRTCGSMSCNSPAIAWFTSSVAPSMERISLGVPVPPPPSL